MTATWFQDPALTAAFLATMLPFVAFILIMIFARAYPRLSAGLSIAAVTVSLLLLVAVIGALLLGRRSRKLAANENSEGEI